MGFYIATHMEFGQDLSKMDMKKDMACLTTLFNGKYFFWKDENCWRENIGNIVNMNN